MKLGRYLG
ncbi:Protein of unknown function [Lactobacillus delbrueckii subsp. lactis]|nr:Putative uncharacterized protein [Lactobacillus delbrueckii subsp. lactis]CDR80305.1 Protein of unknown function [Lactobacillus delbrueckii subsp. lactis]CDR82562.1 Protein of unknown function [Lactobacillus delbrueckii subsp. lactis]CDR84632.1 Protein of unknown function [Lactobacillus delbrueckii subsp. lactis]